MKHRIDATIALLLPLLLGWACGGPAEPPANPPKIEPVHPTVEKPPPASSSNPRLFIQRGPFAPARRLHARSRFELSSSTVHVRAAAGRGRGCGRQQASGRPG